MKVALVVISLILLSFVGISQDTIVQIDTAQKIMILNPMPVSDYNVLKGKGTGVEVTMYESGTSFGLPNVAGTNYFLSFIQGAAPSSFNAKNSGYVMLLVEDDFYMEAEVSFSEKNNYVIFNKQGVKYYNLLTATGVEFFKKFI